MAFAGLGELLRNLSEEYFSGKDLKAFTGDARIMTDAVSQACSSNSWFIPLHVWHALNSIGLMLDEGALRSWLSNYSPQRLEARKTGRIGVVMAGNIPAVGFHDFLCTLISGYEFSGKLSGADSFLLPALAQVLVNFRPGFNRKIHFSKQIAPDCRAIIATGSNNTNRFFEFLYGGKPHIFRKNRNSVAVITGHESEHEMAGLGEDIFLHFGLGCRSVSKIYLPEGYELTKLTSAFDRFDYVAGHLRYSDNLKYYKAFYSLLERSFTASETLIFLRSTDLASPVSVVNVEYYNSIDKTEWELSAVKHQLQCIAGCDRIPFCTVALGQTQLPMPQDYADRQDTLRFLLDL